MGRLEWRTVGSGRNSGFWLCGGHPNVIHTPTQTKTTGAWMVRAGKERRTRLFFEVRKKTKKTTEMGWREVGRGSREKIRSLGGKKVSDSHGEEKLHDSGIDEREGEIVRGSGEEKKAVKMCIKEI